MTKSKHWVLAGTFASLWVAGSCQLDLASILTPGALDSPTATPSASPTGAPIFAVSPAALLARARDTAAGAAVIAQSAQTATDWQLAATQWQRALELLAAIPADSPEGATAATLRAEYASALAIARRQIPPAPASSPVPSPARTPAAAGTIANPGNGHRYRLTAIGTWEDAQTEAAAAGGYLVAINDASEQAWLVQNFANRDSSGSLSGQPQAAPFAYWIGLTDRQVEGQFRWVSGEPLDYANFAPGEPNNQSPEGWEEDYVAIAFDPNFNPVPGYWNDGNQTRARARGIIELE